MMQNTFITPGGVRSFGVTKPTQFTINTLQGTHPNQVFHPLPPPTGLAPYRLTLESVLPPDRIQQINNAGRLVFHATGDTGGIKNGTPQRIVAMHMVDDLQTANAAFFYHLGDVIYYNGEASSYYDQYYDPYLHYNAPIFGIPGNHDGDALPVGDSSLAAFVENFCAQTPRITPEAGEVPRHAMTQPNVYWTLQAPYVTIIGLYTNVPEGGQLDNDQIAWFQAELQAADEKKALIVAMHHPIYSFDTFHSGSVYMSRILDEAVSATNRVPDIVLSGHVHNYQRFTRQFTDAGGQQRDIPYIVAGAGGYFHLHYEQSQNNNLITPGHTVKDGNTDVKLESYCDNRHGFLRLEVSADEIAGTYFTVPRPQEKWGDPATSFDTFTLHLKTHRL